MTQHHFLVSIAIMLNSSFSSLQEFDILQIHAENLGGNTLFQGALVALLTDSILGPDVLQQFSAMQEPNSNPSCKLHIRLVQIRPDHHQVVVRFVAIEGFTHQRKCTC